MPEYVCGNPKCGITFRKKYRHAKGAYCSVPCYVAVRTIPLDVEEAMKLYESGLRVKQIGERLNVPPNVIHNAFKRAGFHRARYNRDQRGEKNPKWNGGKRILNGYVKVRKPDHPRADRTGYVFEHIVVGEEKIGRPLVWKGIGHPESEVVHHIDHDRQNNDPANLEVMTYAEHRQHHLERRSSPTARNHSLTIPTRIYEQLQEIALAWGTSINEIVVSYIKEGIEGTQIRTRAYGRPAS